MTSLLIPEEHMMIAADVALRSLVWKLGIKNVELYPDPVTETTGEAICVAIDGVFAGSIHALKRTGGIRFDFPATETRGGRGLEYYSLESPEDAGDGIARIISYFLGGEVYSPSTLAVA